MCRERWLTTSGSSCVQADDVWELPTKDHSRELLASYNAWRAKHPGQKLNLWKVLAAKFWRRWAVAGLLYVVWCASAALQPIQ